MPSYSPRLETGIDHIAAADTRKEFPHAADRSKEIIFGTTLMDGRQIYIKGPQVHQFITHGVVLMNGYCRFPDGTATRIEIRMDSNGDKGEVVSLLGFQPRPKGISEFEWQSKISKSALVDAPDEVMEMIGGLVDEFLKQIKPIVAFRKAAVQRIEATLTSSPKKV